MLMGTRFLLGGDENILELDMVMAAQLREYTEKPGRILNAF